MEKSKLYRNMASEMQYLGVKMKKVKAERCMDTYSKVTQLFNSLNMNRQTLRKDRAQN